MSRLRGYLSIELNRAETEELSAALRRGEPYRVVVGKLPRLDIGVAFDIKAPTAWDFDNDSGTLTIRRKL